MRWNPISSAWRTRFRGFIEDYDYVFDPSQRVNKLVVTLVDLFEIGSARRDELVPAAAGSATRPQPATARARSSTSAETGQRPHRTCPRRRRHPRRLLRRLHRERQAVQDHLLARRVRADGDPRGRRRRVPRRLERVRRPARPPVLPRTAGEVRPGRRRRRRVRRRLGLHRVEGRRPRRRRRRRHQQHHADPPVRVQPRTVEGHQLRVGDAVGRSPTPTSTASASKTPPPSAEYGVRSWSAQSLLTKHGEIDDTTALEETKRFASYYVNNYKQPKNRITEIGFRTMHPDWDGATETWNLLCRIDIADIGRSHRSTRRAAAASPAKTFFVEGIHETSRPLNPDYDDIELTLDLSPAHLLRRNPWGDTRCRSQLKPIIHGRDHLPRRRRPDPLPASTPAPAGTYDTAIAAASATCSPTGDSAKPAAPCADTSGFGTRPPTSPSPATASTITPDVAGALDAAQDDGAVAFNLRQVNRATAGDTSPALGISAPLRHLRRHRRP